MYLLDTHVLLWLASDQNKLSEAAIAIIKGNAGNLFISAISAFEITLKVIRKRLELPMRPELWIPEALHFHHIEEIPVNSKIATQSVLLPEIHNDPCDRIIIATAQINHMILLTADKIIVQYPDIDIKW